MLSGRKVLLEKPQIQDADVLQKWYLDKEFRLLYDGYRGNSLDMVMAEIKARRDITDPHAERLNFGACQVQSRAHRGGGDYGH